MSDHRAIEDAAQALLEATDAPLIVIDPSLLPHLEDCDPSEQRCSCSSRAGFEPGGHPCHCLATLLEIGADRDPVTTVKAAEIDIDDLQRLVKKAVGLDPAMAWPAVMSVLRDFGRRGDLLALSEGERLSSVEARVDALELAERERAQSGGAPRVDVAGGGFVPEYRTCGADREDGADPRTCQRRVRHDGICGPQRDT